MTADADPEIFASATRLVAGRIRPPGRIIVGIAGPPGAGKSTLASALMRAFSARIGPGGAVTVPMDGFHLSNLELDRLGLADRKGAPETFDAAGFAHLLARIRVGDELVYAPAYSRLLHESIGGVIPVFPWIPLVLVEGNYLLLADQPWVRARPLFDLVIYLDAPTPVRVAALMGRQRSRGLDEAQARDWVLRSDEANARLVATTRRYADAVLCRSGPAMPEAAMPEGQCLNPGMPEGNASTPECLNPECLNPGLLEARNA